MKLIRTGEHYRSRAEECRTIADLLTEEPRKQMLGVAADYEMMAKVADDMREQTAMLNNSFPIPGSC